MHRNVRVCDCEHSTSTHAALAVLVQAVAWAHGPLPHTPARSRRLLLRLIAWLREGWAQVDRQGRQFLLGIVSAIMDWIQKHHGINGMMSQTYSAGIMVFWTLAMFLVFLVMYLAA